MLSSVMSLGIVLNVPFGQRPASTFETPLGWSLVERRHKAASRFHSRGDSICFLDLLANIDEDVFIESDVFISLFYPDYSFCCCPSQSYPPDALERDILPSREVSRSI